MIRPPLDKARSLFVLPTTTSAGKQVVVSVWVPQAAETQPAFIRSLIGGEKQQPLTILIT